MSLIIDLIVLAIILFFTLLGYKKGLVKVAISICTFFIAIIVSFMFYKPLSSLIMQKTTIDETIQKTITSSVKLSDTSNEQINDLSANLPDFILKNGENTIQSVSVKISTVLINIACFLIIYIVAKIILHFVSILADAIAKLPILKQFNKLGGTIYGFLEGLFVVFVGFAIISLIAPLIDTSILESIQSTSIASILFNNNILLKFLA